MALNYHGTKTLWKYLFWYMSKVLPYFGFNDFFLLKIPIHKIIKNNLNYENIILLNSQKPRANWLEIKRLKREMQI